MRRCLVIAAKEPALGSVKTRLAATIGADAALALYRCFLADTIALADTMPDCQLAFSFWPATASAFFARLRPGCLLLPQCGANLGERMLNAFEQASANGYNRIVLIGSDLPGLPVAHVERAFAALDRQPAVLGPADDGGYYLLGLRAPQPALFHSGIAWSTPSVAQQTLAAAAAARLDIASVPLWYDIDTADDLRRLYADLRARTGGAHAPATLAQLDALAQNEGLRQLLFSC
ncbi:MAG: TIGR04282 family arsenosugar biosynthesis glycosyltransferase [Chloroflexales bacterium]|nr:TIGR04282 family arsenosugar biosynthesis glycosyltransferase [Chloroflexales bacterium]